jgi:hypothetical protein
MSSELLSQEHPRHDLLPFAPVVGTDGEANAPTLREIRIRRARLSSATADRVYGVRLDMKERLGGRDIALPLGA